VDDVTLMKIAHLVVSHHGTNEWGSPKEPAIPEALVLSQIDKMDANLDRMQFLIDDIAKGRLFARDKDTFYDKMDERTIYLK
jgi:3'-5' exoribonuclease